MSKINVEKTTVNITDAGNNHDTKLLHIDNATFYTTNYKEDKFKTKTKTKGITIYVNPEDEKKLTNFGLTMYTATDEKTKEQVCFVMTKFSGNLIIYDTESKTKKRYLFDNSKPNVTGEGYDLIIMGFDSDQGQHYTRVVAMKGQATKLERQSIDYFGVDDEYTDITNE